MTGTRAAHVQVAAVRRERLEDRLERLDRLPLAADHQAIADLETPDPAARPGVHVVDALCGEVALAALIVMEVRIAAVDDRVAGLEMLEEVLDLGLGRVARRDHDPDGAWLLELVDKLADRKGGGRPLPRDLLSSSPASGCRPRPRAHRGGGDEPCSRPSGRVRRNRSASEEPPW